MKHYLFSLLFFSLTTLAFAVPAAQVTISHTQSDGTELSLTLVGDEHLHYYINAATGEAMRQGADGDYYVITDAELQTQTANAATRRAQINQQRVARLPRMQADAAEAPARTIGNFGTMTGTKKGLVILVNFADKAMTTGTQAKFDNMFNQQGYNQDGHIGSVADYFKAQSYGQFELSFDVVGPVTLSNNMSYYGGNNTAGSDKNPGAMIKEACNAVNSQVNFADYDWTGNGYVDQVFVIYAGFGENYGGADENTIWPHEWTLTSATGSCLKLDNVWIDTYACCAELYGTRGTTLNGMGTACHEFSHCLGYPDTYDTDYSGGIGMDSYDIMCGGSYNGPNGRGEVPSGFTAYERWMAGWLTPTELSSAANITNMKDLGTEGEAYIIYNSSNRNEYFLLENRQSKEWFRYYDSNIAGHGLFITHVDFNQTAWNNNTPNDAPNHQRMVWVPADKDYGTYDATSKSWSISSSQQKGDYFPGTSNVKSFKPTASAWNTTGGKWFTSESGSYYTNHDLSEITENTTTGTISFLFDGGLQDDGSRYTITLDACGGTVSPTRWTQTSYKQTWSLPEPTTTVVGWYGAGWSLTKINSNTPLDDVDLIDYDQPYEPESNVTLYAVYYNEDFICNSYPANTHYTVTYNAGAGTCNTANWTQTDQQQKTTLPTATINVDGWTFAGWATASVIETLAKPSLLAAGADYTPSANVTLYAVYKKSTGGNGKISSVDEITDGSQYVFVISDGTTSYAVEQSSNNYVSFNESAEFTSSIIWTAATATNGFSFKCNSKYLYNSGSNTTISTENATATDWVFTSLGSNAFKMQRVNTSGRYIGWNGSKFAAYANNNFVNQIATSATLAQYAGALYIYKIGGRTTYNSNPQQGGDPEPGDGDDDDDEPGEGGDITITPISGIPNGYYNSTIVGKNDRTLELALKAIVNPHTKIDYNSLWTAFKTTDVVPTSLLNDPAKTDQVYDMYANINTFTKYYSDNDHSQTGGINREHCVPNSWWGRESGNATAYTDLHHLVPGDGAANNAKSNHPLGEYKSGMTLHWPTETKTNTSGYTYVVADNTGDHTGSWSHVWNTTSGTKVFEPADEFKGDFARMYLYVVCAYEGDLNWQTADNTMFSNGANNYTVISSDAKALLLKWHRQDPVSDKERMRNNAVQSIQGNRNPFIDYPILVEYIWGDSIEKTSFSLEKMPSAYQFAVTYHVRPNVTCSEQVHLCDRGSAVTLPTATTSVEGWAFRGWATSAIENTTTAPSLLTGNYTPTENIDLYAVFQAGDTYSIAPEELQTPEPDPETPSTTALYFPHIAKLGQPFTAPAFTTNSDGAQTWTSSNTNVAEVDNEGHVTIKAVGTTIITVTQAETATYTQASASYMIKVVE